MPRAKRQAKRAASPTTTVPMVYDGYQGGFVLIEAACFDVSLTPEAVVMLPLDVLEDQRAAADG
jgi:hypothetical protein